MDIHKNIKIFDPSVTVYVSISITHSLCIFYSKRRLRSNFYLIGRIDGRINLVFSYNYLYHLRILNIDLLLLNIVCGNHRRDLIGNHHEESGASYIAWCFSEVFETDLHAWINAPLKGSIATKTEYSCDISRLQLMQINESALNTIQRFSNEFDVLSTIRCEANGRSGLSGTSQGREPRNPDQSLGIGGLTPSDFTHLDYGQPQPASLKTENEKLKNAHYDKAAVEPPITRRFLLSICGVVTGFWLSVWGWYNFDNKRRLLGAALLGIGWTLGAAGFGLWWLTELPTTWGWWL
jgi:hypothetical protein